MTAATHLWTEQAITALLRNKHCARGTNGDQWAFLTQVRSAAGFDSRRTLDALAFGLWPSRGLHIHGFEIKVSRSDWLRELKAPEKAEEFCGIVDFFWVVTPPDVVQGHELPAKWGHIVTRGQTQLRTVRGAEALHDLTDSRSGQIDRSVVAAMLRSALGSCTSMPDELQAARQEGMRLGRERAEEKHKFTIERKDELEGAVRTFREVTGIDLVDGGYLYRGDAERSQAERVAAAVKTVMDGEADVERHRKDLERMERTLERTLEEVRKTRAEHEPGLESVA